MTLVEIIREPTKTEESKDVTSEETLAYGKIIEAQKAQSAIINSLNRTKDFDVIKTVRGQWRQIEKNCKHVPKHL